jgi:sarcosine oxidase subunit beta
MAKHRPDLVDEIDPLGIGLVCRPTAAGSLLVGVTQERGVFEPGTTPRGLNGLARRAMAILPGLKDVTLMRTFSGARPSSETGFPIVCMEPAAPGYILASGHAGDGVALSPITGRYVADLVNRSSTIDRSIASIFDELGALAVEAHT